MTIKQWYQAICIANEEQALLIQYAFQSCDALSVTLSDGSDNQTDARFAHEASQAENVWPQTKIIALFNEELACKSAIETVQILVPNCPTIAFDILAERNWVHEGQKNFPTQVYDGLTLYPSWDEAYTGCTQAYIRLDPGLAFGTGTHPTTFLCLDWIAKHDMSHQSVFDFGCGSGILALACLAKGAAFVDAIDHDPQAIIASQQNLDLNKHIDPQKLYISTEWPIAKTYDLILANVLANPLIEFSQSLINLLADNGKLILSGILKEEQNTIIEAYKTLSVKVVEQKDEWILIELVKEIPSCDANAV